MTGNRAVTNYNHIEPKAEFARWRPHRRARWPRLDLGLDDFRQRSRQREPRSAGLFRRHRHVWRYNSPAVIENTTISDNTAASAAGGLYATSIVKIRNSTIAFNIGMTGAPYLGPFSAGLHVDAPWFDLSSTIVANNATAGSLDDLSGVAEVIGASNLVTLATIPVPPDTLFDDPLLAGLGDNGGPTPTHALLPASPAIDHGSNDAGPRDRPARARACARRGLRCGHRRIRGRVRSVRVDLRRRLRRLIARQASTRLNGRSRVAATSSRSSSCSIARNMSSSMRLLATQIAERIALALHHRERSPSSRTLVPSTPAAFRVAPIARHVGERRARERKLVLSCDVSCGNAAAARADRASGPG